MPTRIFLILFLLLTACSQKQLTEQAPSPRPVKVVKVESLGTIDKFYTGTVEAREFSMLAFKVSGTLTALNVSEGQLIPRGYIIARINPDDYRWNYETAEANYQTAKSIYERTRRLQEQDATAVQNLEIAEADFIQAGAALNIARSSLGYTVLKAPFNGLIEKKYAENYQEVAAGEAIVRLVNPDSLEVRFVLPETSIEIMNSPKKIYVQFDTYPERWFQAEIKEFVYSSDGSGIPVTLKITDPDFAPARLEIFPGFSCKVMMKIENTIADRFIIPASALMKEGKKYYVWIVNADRKTVRRQQVKILRFEDQALVKEGLNSHDLIVTAGVDDLKEGQSVNLQTNPS